MNIERPASYHPETWGVISKKLAALSLDELRGLAARAGIEFDGKTEDDITGELIQRGSFLLVEFGLMREPELMRGTLFEYGGIEYVIDEPASRLLASDDEPIRVMALGGGKSHSFTRSELTQALVTSRDFDQMNR